MGCRGGYSSRGGLSSAPGNSGLGNTKVEGHPQGCGTVHANHLKRLSSCKISSSLPVSFRPPPPYPYVYLTKPVPQQQRKVTSKRKAALWMLLLRT
jgi:hypothetical protein